METSENKTTESNIYGNYATYSPEDDKIRLYFMSRIPKDDWDKFISAGFVWTMKQESDLSRFVGTGRDCQKKALKNPVQMRMFFWE